MLRAIIILAAETGMVIFAVREFKGFIEDFKRYTKAERKRRFLKKHAAWEKTRKVVFYDVHSAMGRDRRASHCVITLKNPNIEDAFSKDFNVRAGYENV